MDIAHPQCVWNLRHSDLLPRGRVASRHDSRQRQESEIGRLSRPPGTRSQYDPLRRLIASVSLLAVVVPARAPDATRNQRSIFVQVQGAGGTSSDMGPCGGRQATPSSC